MSRYVIVDKSREQKMYLTTNRWHNYDFWHGQKSAEKFNDKSSALQVLNVAASSFPDCNFKLVKLVPKKKMNVNMFYETLLSLAQDAVSSGMSQEDVTHVFDAVADKVADDD